MNIQGANELSALFGSESLGALQQGLVNGAGDQAGFASALMEQLGLLQATDSPDLSQLQSLMQEAAAGSGVQDFAALFGKNLPAATSGSQDIDLENTLQTLAEVMQQLQQLEADSLPMPMPATDIASHESWPIESELPQTTPDQAAQAGMPVVLPGGMPIDVNDAAEQASEPSEGALDAGVSLAAGDVMEANKPAAQLVQERNAGVVATTASPDELAVEFDRSISAMLSNQDANGKPQQDNAKAALAAKSALDLKPETVAGQLENTVDESGGKTAATGIAGDIARMSNAVRGETAATLPAQQPAMQKHFSDPGWHQELGDKLVWMHKQAVPSVELRLNPEHLGPIFVKIDVSHDQATVAFTAQHLAVKEAIEAAIPKLREMLGGQQLNLADVNVSQQQPEQRQSPREFFQMAGQQGRQGTAQDEALANGAVNEAQDIVDEIEAGRAIASNGLLSLFA